MDLQFGEGQEYLSLDFTRCERPDGSAYGTGGQCRKGTPAPKSEDKMGKKARAAAAGSQPYTPKEPNREELGTVIRGEIESQRSNGHELANMMFQMRLEDELPSDTKAVVGGLGDIEMANKTASGTMVKSSFGYDEGFGFQVNGSFNAGKITDRREQMAIALTVRKHYDAVVRALPVGATIKTSAWSQDGDEMYQSRVKAYLRMGFSRPKEKGGDMYSTKAKEGTMVPGNRRAFRAGEKDPDAVFFKEADHDKYDVLWLVAIFGIPSGDNFSESLDFTRCERPDGSAYGTAGQCRKGAPAEKTKIDKEMMVKVAMSEPFAQGGFSEIYEVDGKIVKVQEDGYMPDIQKEMAMQKMAADAGLAPQVHDIKEASAAVVILMDPVPKGFKNRGDEPLLPEELSKSDQIAAGKLYGKMLKAGIVHADYHSGNWFINGKGETTAIDFGIASKLSNAPVKHLNKAAMYMAPVLRTRGAGRLATQLENAYGNERKLRALMPKIADELVKD
jgi:tRNA A-37 threonylcarbamoyl transferase component Bud32